jgi:hypothetical protein
MVGPPCVATNMSASIAACHSLVSCTRIGQLGDVERGVAGVDQRLPAGQHDRFEKLLIPRRTNMAWRDLNKTLTYLT